MDTGEKIVSLNPAKPAEVVGTVAAGGAAQIDEALAAAWRAFPGWAACPAAERAAVTIKLAAELRRRKLELAAWETLEAAKNWLEAEADVAEAIDFCEYYARQALELARPVPTNPWPGEINQSWLQPLGAGVVISPWNFPLAILVGMTMGPVAAGNTVVLKPSSNTPVTAAVFMEAVAAAGLPPGVINFLPAAGGRNGGLSGGSSPGPLYQLHRLQGSGTENRVPGGPDPARPAMAQASLSGNGRQGCHGG